MPVLKAVPFTFKTWLSKQDFSLNDCQKILQEAFPHEIRGNKLMEVLYLK